MKTIAGLHIDKGSNHLYGYPLSLENNERETQNKRLKALYYILCKE